MQQHSCPGRGRATVPEVFTVALKDVSVGVVGWVGDLGDLSNLCDSFQPRALHSSSGV